ncbi:uncharacterized protein HMPREF1541_08710 [Cyphellophora europaea CBS 101466]|uniref:Zn(2)-C6 fungal-type domain-containing protein n=1 Tax=Cyphellophora europaea (strain CBS 101466) TaxID=1220924 RepID=W2RIX4_CYPE1|nr:uncharacterized protein HMPREF1541_08710 [Cyphellophora europaea CBS 101466]ETN36432.1 hypothetical protein HMPREF1541_08710 [Cyphellophora europaea CBS 101466]
MNEGKEKKEPARAALSCLECRRRKQKCSREWPCNHCAARKLSHLCRFSAAKDCTNQSIEDQQQSRKRSHNGEDDDSAIDVGIPHNDVFTHIETHLPEYNLSKLASEVWLSSQVQPKTTAQHGELQRAIRVLPSRSITDSLVQHFLGTVNYTYDAIYAPTFLEDYTRWWADRAARRPLSPEFTCLLVRACSHVAQYLSPAMRESLEFELAESASTLSERLHQAAEALSSTFTPGEKGITQVQQLFLVVVYLKGEGRFIDAWHAMATCVREAQEQGLHLDDRSLDISEYEREMRRRLWTIIYVWDWLMSKWLGRPLLADPDSCTFQLPTLQLEFDPEKPDVPSPFAHLNIQVELIRRITPALRNADVDPSEDKVKDLRKILDDWSASLAPVWSYEAPDTSWDDAYPNIKWQRELLHGTAAMIALIPFRPYLTRNAVAENPETQAWFLGLGIEVCILNMDLVKRAYAYMSLYSPKHFYINFIFFDITTVLISALIHDPKQLLPGREAALRAVNTGLDNLGTMAKFSKAGATSSAFVTKLAQSIPLSKEERSRWSFGSRKRPKTDHFWPKSQTTYDPVLHKGLFVSGSDPSPATSESVSQSVSSNETLQESVVVPSLQDFECTDFGVIEELWDWQALNLDLSAGGMLAEQPGLLHLPLT